MEKVVGYQLTKVKCGGISCFPFATGALCIASINFPSRYPTYVFSSYSFPLLLSLHLVFSTFTFIWLHFFVPFGYGCALHPSMLHQDTMQCVCLLCVFEPIFSSSLIWIYQFAWMSSSFIHWNWAHPAQTRNLTSNIIEVIWILPTFGDALCSTLLPNRKTLMSSNSADIFFFLVT